MKSDSTTIADLFDKESFYEIPEFQRPFSWDKENFQDLIDDLMEASGPSEYFLGTIVYYIENNVRMVVDGQQRLTSLMILLSCLRDAIESVKTKSDLQNLIIQPEDTVRDIAERDRLIVRDHEMFHKMVSEDGGTILPFDPRDFDEPSNRYIIARDVFKKKLATIGQEHLVEFMKYVSNKCRLIYLQADTFDEAFKLFEVVNDRGRQLRRIDLLKSHNLHPDYVPNKIKRTQLAAQWDKDESSLGEGEFEALFNMIRFIMTKSKPAEDLFSEFKKRIFDESKMQRGVDFFSEVSDFVDDYQKIFVDRDYLKGEPRERQFEALMAIMDNQLATFEWRACVLAFAKKFERDQIYEFCLAVEKVALIHLVDGVRKDERYSDYVAILNSIEKAAKPQDALKSIVVDASKIEHALSTEDVYKKPYEKYVLLRLELAAAELDQIRCFEARTTEHVFPQNPNPGGVWDGQASPDQRKKFVNKLGNLVLLSKGKNSAASNREFSEKKASYLGPRVSDFPRSNQVMQYDTWDEAIIMARTADAAALVLAPPPI